MLTATRGSHAACRYDTFLLSHQRWCEALPDRQARLAGNAQRPPSLDTGARQQYPAAARRHQYRVRRTAAFYIQLPPAAVAAHLDTHAVRARTGSDRSRRRVSPGLVCRPGRAPAQYSAGRFLPFASGAVARPPFRKRHRTYRHALPAPGVLALRPGAGAQPPDERVSCATRYRAQRLPAARGGYRGVLAGATRARSAPRAAADGRRTAAGVCRPVFRGKESAGTAPGDGAAG